MTQLQFMSSSQAWKVIWKQTRKTSNIFTTSAMVQLHIARIFTISPIYATMKLIFTLNMNETFISTSDGKSPCDGIGGTAKWLQVRASILHPFDKQILTPNDLFVFYDQNLTGIKFCLNQKEEIEAITLTQEESFENSHTIAGMRENHSFVPIKIIKSLLVEYQIIQHISSPICQKIRSPTLVRCCI